jgi:hypothetical protein
MRLPTALCVAFAAFSLAGCGTTQHDEDPYYDSGFSDGCETGTARTPGTPVTKPVRDQQLWDESEGYRAGWRAGYGSCSPASRGDIPGDR